MERGYPYARTAEQEAIDCELEAINDLLAGFNRLESPETMATIKQIDANRQNALKSTGPKSTQGKAAVAQNALKHGLYASTLLLPEEDPAQHDALCQLYIDNYQPEGLDEIDLLESIVGDKWELARLNLMKQGVYGQARKYLRRSDKKGEENHPTAAQICMEVGADNDYNKSLARLSQLEGRIQRHFERATRELRKLQQQRRDRPPQPEPEPNADVAAYVKADVGRTPGRTPGSARVPLDPFSAKAPAQPINADRVTPASEPSGG